MTLFGTHPRRASALICVLLAWSTAAAAQAGSVEIWMRAFIPQPGASATPCLETQFSLIPTGRNTAVVRPDSHRTSAAASARVDCIGSVERDDIVAPAFVDGSFRVAGQVAGSSEHGPAINYNFELRWRPLPGELAATVSVSASFAFEMYARTPGRSWVEVVRGLPGNGVGFTSWSEAVTLPVLDGTWESDDAQRRFRLQIRGASAVWTERDAVGGELTRQLPIWFGDDAATISRANDAEVLSFLGFQPELRAQILARAPIPSFITLSIDDQALLAEWFGVLVIKDGQGRLKRLVEPGARPPKRFRLQRRSM